MSRRLLSNPWRFLCFQPKASNPKRFPVFLSPRRQKPFWLKPFFVQTLHCLLACGECAVWSVSFAATVLHATSRVASVRHPFRMVRGDPWSSAAVSSVASGETCAIRQPQVIPGRQRRWDWAGSSRATRGPQHQSPAPRLDPDERCAAAQTKVQRLEAALAAFGEEDSTEKDVLKDFLARAVEQAKSSLWMSASSLARTTSRNARNNSRRPRHPSRIARRRLRRAKRLQPPEPRVRQEDVESEVVRLRKQVFELQQKFRPHHPVQGSEEAFENLRKRAAKRRVCPDRPPSHEQDLEFWMSDKHLELRDALDFGDTPSVLELSTSLS